MFKKAFLWIALLSALCLCGLAQASITRVGTATASATTVTCPAHLAGDLIVIEAVRGASTTAPTLPSGYTSILTKSNSTATSVSMRIGYKTATGTADSSGTWTNAAELICAVFRPSSGNVLRIGQSASSSSTTATVTFPALTMGDSFSGNSWIVGFAGAGNKTQTLTTAPTGMTNEASVVGATYEAALHDTEGGVSSWSSTTASATGTGSTVSATIEIVLSPTSDPLSSYIYQHVAGGGNPYAQNDTGNTYKLPLPKVSGAGNTIILALTNDGGATVSSVSGSINGSYGSPAITALQGSGNLDSRIYVLQNVAAGQEVITVTYAANIQAFQYVITELHGVATSGGTAGTHSNGATQTTATSTGSFTPTNNNGTGGNLLWAYFVKSNQVPNSLVSGIFPSQNFTLLNADIMWGTGNYSLSNAAEAYIQTTSAAINPGIVSVADSGDDWNSLVVALPISAGSGTAPAPGIQIQQVEHFTSLQYPTAGTQTIHVTMIGNLGLLTSDGVNPPNFTVTDNMGNTWTNDGTDAGFWYLPNASPNPNLILYVTCSSGATNNLSWRFLDISGAATSPFDSSVFLNQSLNGLSGFTASPAPTPTSSAGITIANIGLGLGPGLAVTAPSGAVFDLPTYTGETDSDSLDNADILAHRVYSSAGAQTWTFTITNQASNSNSGGFISFKQAPAPSGGAPASQFFLGMLLPELRTFPRGAAAYGGFFELAAGQ